MQELNLVLFFNRNLDLKHCSCVMTGKRKKLTGSLAFQTCQLVLKRGSANSPTYKSEKMTRVLMKNVLKAVRAMWWVIWDWQPFQATCEAVFSWGSVLPRAEIWITRLGQWLPLSLRGVCGSCGPSLSFPSFKPAAVYPPADVVLGSLCGDTGSRTQQWQPSLMMTGPKPFLHILIPVEIWLLQPDYNFLLNHGLPAVSWHFHNALQLHPQGFVSIFNVFCRLIKAPADSTLG